MRRFVVTVRTRQRDTLVTVEAHNRWDALNHRFAEGRVVAAWEAR